MFRFITQHLVGTSFTLPENWMVLIKPQEFMDRPIHYLEVGAHCGANLICVAASYAKHPDSKLYAIDPWEDYEEYPEYKSSQSSIYTSFLQNIESFPLVKEKLQYFKDYSNKVIPTFPDDLFDIIYIDGNHQPEYVLEDGVLAFRKLKKGGVMIFDDYNYGGLDVTKRGVDAFLTAYRDRIHYIGFYGGQIFLKKN
jgi:predicted O-methyltransferase YrrM